MALFDLYLALASSVVTMLAHFHEHIYVRMVLRTDKKASSSCFVANVGYTMFAVPAGFFKSVKLNGTFSLILHLRATSIRQRLDVSVALVLKFADRMA